MKLLRWVARVLSGLVITFHVLSFLGDHSFVALSEIDRLNLVVWGIILLGMVVAWKWEGWGGIIILGAFVVQVILHPDVLFMWAMWAAPFIGMLFLICWIVSRNKKQVTA